jgi:hypothetical protein
MDKETHDDLQAVVRNIKELKKVTGESTKLHRDTLGALELLVDKMTRIAERLTALENTENNT